MKEILKNNSKKIVLFGVVFVLVIFITILLIKMNKPIKDDIVNKDDQEEKIVQSNERDETRKQIKVITLYINIRKNKDVTSDILGQVHMDEVYTIISEDESNTFKWIEIETNNNIHGYISGISDYVERLSVISENESEKPSTPTKPSGNKTNSNNNTSNSNNNNNTNNKNQVENVNKPNQIEKTDEEAKKCEKTCDTGYTLKNSDSSECYCEKNQTEAKVVDATEVRYCPDDYELKQNSYCELIKYSDINVSYYCPYGYQLSEDGKKCIGIVKKDTQMIARPTCVGGSDKDLFQMTAYPGYGCRKGTLKFSTECPNGYERKYKISEGYVCEWKYSGTETSLRNKCPSNYPTADIESGKCIYKKVSGSKIKYTCSEGFRLVGKKCYKNN